MLRFQTFKRFAHCIGCGNELILPLSRSKTFNAAPNTVGKQVQDNYKLETMHNDMSAAQREALGWSQLAADHDMLSKAALQTELQIAEAKRATKSSICKPCIMAREGTINPLDIPKTNEAHLGRIFHIIDALDFPLGVPQNTTGSDVFVINRCDLLISHESQLSKLKNYVLETVFTPRGISEDRVILTSAKMKWHLSKLSEFFLTKPKSNYFIGSSGAGKTALVHALSGTSQKSGATTWPLPFATQRALAYKSLPKYRSKTLIDAPSLADGLSALTLILPSILRKVIAGPKMIKKDPKYTLPKIRAKSGQFVSIGGLVALEFPPLERRMPVHVFAGIGGLAHTDLGHAFKDMTKITEVNASVDPNHLKLRMHDHLGLQLYPKTTFRPWSPESRTRQSAVIKGMGFLQPFLFGDFPPDYQITIWAPSGTDVGFRREVLPYLFT